MYSRTLWSPLEHPNTRIRKVSRFRQRSRYAGRRQRGLGWLGYEEADEPRATQTSQCGFPPPSISAPSPRVTLECFDVLFCYLLHHVLVKAKSVPLSELCLSMLCVSCYTMFWNGVLPLPETSRTPTRRYKRNDPCVFP